MIQKTRNRLNTLIYLLVESQTTGPIALAVTTGIATRPVRNR